MSTRCLFRCLGSSSEPDSYRRRERNSFGVATDKWAADHELQLAKLFAEVLACHLRFTGHLDDVSRLMVGSYSPDPGVVSTSLRRNTRSMLR